MATESRLRSLLRVAHRGMPRRARENTLAGFALALDAGADGIELDVQKNQTAKGEALLSTDRSRVQIWIMPTNEELVVARQAKALLEAQ